MKYFIVLLAIVMINAFVLSSVAVSYPGYASGTTDSDGTTTSTMPVNDPKVTNIFPGEIHFASMQMLTVEGENAEAYWSSDGTQLVLQRHVEQDTCDQIYIYDLETEKLTMVSNGDGVTT